MNDPLLEHFQSQWKQARGMTRDLSMALSEEELKASPGGSLGPWWKQFRHVGRVQENYLGALVTGKVKFGFAGTTYSGDGSKQTLADYLDRLNQRLEIFIERGFPHPMVDWFGEPKTVAQHLLYMADHETLHHGQWIVYRKLLGGAFPRSWAAWGM